MKVFLGILAVVAVLGIVGFVRISRRFDRIRKSEDTRKAERQRQLVEGGLNAELDYIVNQLDRELEQGESRPDAVDADHARRLRELREVLLDNRDRVPQPFDAAAAVAEEISACRALDLEGILEFVPPTADASRVVGTPVLFRWAVRELVSNTLAHAGAWSRIEIRLEPDDSEGTVLSVADDGEGPDLMAVSRLYGPFTPRIDSSGPGLGLFAVRSIVESMGGSIHASPGSDGGLTHTLQLPSHLDQESRLPSIARRPDDPASRPSA